MVVARDNKMHPATNQGTRVNDNRLTQEEIDELGLRTKVAIVDNGVDIGQPAISANIRRGRSFVNSYASTEWLLPWYTAAHAHGTYMASLVVKVDPCCDLYVYRINTLPVGRILSEHAARVCVSFACSSLFSIFPSNRTLLF
jgi:subtilisin family serine protease